VLATLGKTGDFKDAVLKVNIPRTDLACQLPDGRRRRRSALAAGLR
jgi:hypothetical protein